MAKDIDNAYLTLEILRGRWKLFILRHLTAGPSRTGQMMRALEGIAKNRLNQNLKELERLGILSRKSFPGRVPRVEYVLTKRGHSLAPVIESLERWGAENRSLRRLKTARH
ncbi:MAG TPA: helix-turn-helix domain-containing protein [Elusimicrobiota bacterium]|nr:helix-turn-helix domain-containing protein [Elusimicrobiota bacterium]